VMNALGSQIFGISGGYGAQAVAGAFAGHGDVIPSRGLAAKAGRAAWVWAWAPRTTDVACIRASMANRLRLDG
jgi:hypothetical protein